MPLPDAAAPAGLWAEAETAAVRDPSGAADRLCAATSPLWLDPAGE